MFHVLVSQLIVKMAGIGPTNRAVSSPDEDIFDSIVMAEERFHEEGFHEGVSAGRTASEQEGYKMGLEKGRQIGSEYGFYLGFVGTWQQLVKKEPTLAKPRTVKALNALLEQLVSFQVENMTDENYWDDFSKIRDKFKQVASQLNVKLDFSNERTPRLAPLSF